MKYFPKNKTARCVISIYSIVAVVLWVLYLSSNESDIFNRLFFDFLLNFLIASYFFLMFVCQIMIYVNLFVAVTLYFYNEQAGGESLWADIKVVFAPCVYLFFIVQFFLVVFFYPMNHLCILWNYYS